MSRATSIINRLNQVLNRVATPGQDTRKAYKRVFSRTGGDDLIGVVGTVSKTDTLLAPQPVFQRVTRMMFGTQAKSQEVLDVAKSEKRTANEWEFIFSPTAVSISDLQNENLVFVLKDTNGDEEVLDVIDYEPIGAFGADLVYAAYLRSIQRP